ncbi:MAG: hypothetical protein ACNS61_16080 [Candidatus Wenzhouxiangella sp. M2_3B_020]
MNGDLERENKLLVLLLNRAISEPVVSEESVSGEESSGAVAPNRESSEEKFGHLQDSARKLQDRNRSLRRQLVAARREIDALRGSVSWRITAPVRATVSFLSGIIRTSR